MKIFISLPAKNLGSLSSVSCSNISLIQDCLDRLQRKLKEFESLHTTVAADDYVEVPDISESEFQEPIESAPGVKDDSPPFESSPGEVSEKIDRTAPLPITEPNKKFVFKKPGSSSTRQTSSIPAVINFFFNFILIIFFCLLSSLNQSKPFFFGQAVSSKKQDEM